jgi:imidazolonepropionase-like amidohydrolase
MLATTIRACLLVCLASSPLLAAAAEHGTLILHFLQLPVGKETYELVSQPDGSLLLNAHFDYTERGTHVPLAATLHMKPELTPIEFEAKGKSYRPFSVDAGFKASPDGRTAEVRDRGISRTATLPARHFAVAGYAPFSIQMMMVRYWARHGKPSRLTQFPAEAPVTDVTIRVAGEETVEAGNGSRVHLTRYSIGNIVWGRETIWLDDKDQIAAGVSYAGGLPFEAVRAEYLAALRQLIRSAIADRLREAAADKVRLRPLVENNFAITGATLIDGVRNAPIRDSAVVIRDGKIAAVGPRVQVTIPQGMPVVDGRGATLLPGLWDAHAHFAQVEWGAAYLAAGVTSVRDCGGEFEFITAARDAVESGRILGPRLILAGLVDHSGAGAFGVDYADTPEQGRAQVARYQAAGFQQIKIYDGIQLDTLTAIVAEAHRRGMIVTGHVPKAMNPMQAVEAGMDQINHFTVLQPIRDAGDRGGEVIEFFKNHGTVIDPTRAWTELLSRPINIGISTFEPGFEHAPYSLSSLFNTAGLPVTAAPPVNRASSLAVLLALYQAGVPIVAGTDKGIPGHSLHRELEIYVEAGLTPMQAIQLATLGAAKAMRADRETGSVEPGKQADLVLVDGDPLKNIRQLRRIRRVISRGRMYAPTELWRSAGFVY